MSKKFQVIFYNWTETRHYSYFVKATDSDSAVTLAWKKLDKYINLTRVSLIQCREV